MDRQDVKGILGDRLAVRHTSLPLLTAAQRFLGSPFVLLAFRRYVALHSVSQQDKQDGLLLQWLHVGGHVACGPRSSPIK